MAVTNDAGAPAASPGGSADEALAPLLAVAGLEVTYQGVIQAVRGASLEVRPGSIVTLLGPNGAGKTSLLRAITGLLPFHKGQIVRGTVRFDGKDVTGAAATKLVRQGITQALEGRRIFSSLTVEENLRIGAGGKPDKANLERTLGLFPVLAERRAQHGGLLSGGEQQMLAMARALIAEPRLLVLDEPSLGLAPKIVDQVADLIRSINEAGTTVLLVEQNAAVALDVAHHGYLMENGRIVLDQPAEQMRRNPDILKLYMGADDKEDGHDAQQRRRRPRRWLS